MNWEKKSFGYSGHAGAWRFDILTEESARYIDAILLAPPGTISTWDHVSSQSSEYSAPSVLLQIRPCVTFDEAKQFCKEYAAEYLAWED